MAYQELNLPLVCRSRKNKIKNIIAQLNHIGQVEKSLLDTSAEKLQDLRFAYSPSNSVHFKGIQ